MQGINYFDNINSIFFFNIREDFEERNELFEVFLDMVFFLMKKFREYNVIVVLVRYLDLDFVLNLELYGNVWISWE